MQMQKCLKIFSVYYMAYSVFTMDHKIFTSLLSVAQGEKQSNELREQGCPTQLRVTNAACQIKWDWGII